MDELDLRFTFTGSKLSQDLKAIEIVGIIDNICCEKDPDFEWLDK